MTKDPKPVPPPCGIGFFMAERRTWLVTGDLPLTGLASISAETIDHSLGWGR